MVTHRLRVIRDLDVNKVIVLKRGRVAEIGHPEDLLRKGGIYASLALEQGVTPVRRGNYDSSYTDQDLVNGNYVEQQPLF